MPGIDFLTLRMPESFSGQPMDGAARSAEPGVSARHRSTARHFQATLTYLLSKGEYRAWREYVMDNAVDTRWFLVQHPTPRGPVGRKCRVRNYSGTPAGGEGWRLQLDVDVSLTGPFPLPIGCDPIILPFYTTPPYPLEAVDSITGDNRITSGSLAEAYFAVSMLDALDVDTRITSGELRDILQSILAGPDAMDGDGGIILSGELRDTLRVLIMRAEAIAGDGGRITAGQLKNILINYTNYHIEALSGDGGLITGGTLA